MAKNQKWRRQSLKQMAINNKRIEKFFDPIIGTIVYPDKHRWELCEMCGPMVICGICGNNCCNGGSGRSYKENCICDCREAYQIQDQAFALFSMKYPYCRTKTEQERERKRKLRQKRQ